MAHEYEKQFHGCPNGPKTNNGVSDFKLTMGGQGQARENSNESRNEWLRAEGNRQAKKWAVAGSGKPSRILDKRWTIAKAAVASDSLRWPAKAVTLGPSTEVPTCARQTRRRPGKAAAFSPTSMN